MTQYLKILFLFFVLSAGTLSVIAQIRPAQRPGQRPDERPQDRTREREPAPEPTGDALLDSLRKKEEEKQDSVIYTARYIRYTTLDMLKDSTRLMQIDTTVYNFQNYNPILQPANPGIGLGGLGLPYRDLLFSPRKSIGFDAGFHSLDAYLLTQDSIHYYRARSPYTELYYINGASRDQLFRITHSQNITPNWNFGANYFKNGSEGLYTNQKASHLNAAVFSWYESKNKRYNLLANGLFNTLKPAESGAVVNDEIFESEGPLGNAAKEVRLSGSGRNMPRQTWKHKNYFIKQFYYIGRIDSLTADSTAGSVLPTQRVSYALNYASNSYKFFRNEPDRFGAFPTGIADTTNTTNDSTLVKHLSNQLMYSFYLRGKSVKFIKNELKLDVGIKHDSYNYQQMGEKSSFHNTTLKAAPGYRFSDRVNIEGNLEQIVEGRHAGDFFYEANTNFLLSKSVGRIVLGAYLQNKSPEQIFERVNYQFHKWDRSFERTKINNLSFTYLNPKFSTEIRADYYLVTNYLYFRETALPLVIAPAQFGTNINLLKITLKKDFKFGKFNLDNHIVYQKSDFQDLLRTPEVYSYNSFYYSNKFFKVLDTDIGFDMRYNSPFVAPSYAINISQFYNGPAVTFSNYPVVDVWLRANLKRANLFLKYNYINQGLLSKGYYTVNRYPMADAVLAFGVSWKFYD